MALHPAVMKGHLDVVKVLLMTGANVHIQKGEGTTAFHFAAEDYLEIAKGLSMAGADVNIQAKMRQSITLGCF